MELNEPHTFGSPENIADGTMICLNLAERAPQPSPNSSRPTAKRLLQADGVNLITFSFSPGQSLPDHRAAHPIMVQCLKGELRFGCGDQVVSLRPGETVCHLPAYLTHRVDCPADAKESAILLLSMLTAAEKAPQ